MKCERCGKEFNSDIPETNAEIYGDRVCYSCPHCGKLYSFKREITIIVDGVDDSRIYNTEDDWSRPIVKDKDYYNK